MQKNIKLAWVFLRYHYFPHMVLVFAFCCCSVFFASFRNLDAEKCAKILEMYVSIIGILLLTPLFIPEQDREIWSVVKSKKVPMWRLYCIRLSMACIMIVLIILAYFAVFQESNSSFEFGKMFMGSMSETIFLGSIGFMVSAVTNQVVLGYMASVMYYAINIGKSDMFKHLALFQMTKGAYDFAIYMCLGALIFFVFGILIREKYFF